MARIFQADDDRVDVTERRLFSALASVRHKERECASLRQSACAASAAWQSAEADLVRLRMIIDSLDDAGENAPSVSDSARGVLSAA